MLIDGKPIASAALGEFNRPDLLGSFAAWPSNGDVDDLSATIKRGDHYIAASVAFFNASPDAGSPDLGSGLYIFEPEPLSEDFKSALVRTYAGHVGLVQEAHQRVEADMDREQVKRMSAAQSDLFYELAISLAGESRRLIGGYSLISSVETPKRYKGFAFGVLALLERYQIETREATLKGLLDQSEELKHSRLIMKPDSEIESVTHSSIVRRLLSTSDLAEALGVDPPPIEELFD